MEGEERNWQYFDRATGRENQTLESGRKLVLESFAPLLLLSG